MQHGWPIAGLVISMSCCSCLREGPYQGGEEPANVHAFDVYHKQEYLLVGGTKQGWDGGFLCSHDLSDGLIQWWVFRPERVSALAANRDNDLVATAEGSALHLWRVNTDGRLQEVTSLTFGSTVADVCWLDADRLISTTRRSGTFVLAQPGLAIIRALALPEDAGHEVACHSDRRLVAIPTPDGGLRVLEAENWRPLFVFEDEYWQPTTAAWTPDGNRLIGVYRRVPQSPRFEELRIWDTTAWQTVATHRVPDGAYITGVAARNDSVAVFQQDRNHGPTQILVLPFLRGAETAVKCDRYLSNGFFLTDGTRLVARAGAQQIGLWRFAGGRLELVWLAGAGK